MTGGPERPTSFTSQWVHVGADDWVVRCCAYRDEAPILSVDVGRASANITVTGRQGVDAEAVRFARDLASAARQFAAECERLHAGHQNSDQAEDASQSSAGQDAAA